MTAPTAERAPSPFAHLLRDTAPPTIHELFRRVRNARTAGEHDIQAHADLFAALKSATGLSLADLWALHDLVPAPLQPELREGGVA